MSGDTRRPSTHMASFTGFFPCLLLPLKHMLNCMKYQAKEPEITPTVEVKCRPHSSSFSSHFFHLWGQYWWHYFNICHQFKHKNGFWTSWHYWDMQVKSALCGVRTQWMWQIKWYWKLLALTVKTGRAEDGVETPLRSWAVPFHIISDCNVGRLVMKLRIWCIPIIICGICVISNCYSSLRYLIKTLTR